MFLGKLSIDTFRKTERETLKVKSIGKFVAQLYSVQRKNCDKKSHFLSLFLKGGGVSGRDH